MYQVFVKCDHVSPADVKMQRCNDMLLWSNQNLDEAAVVVSMCNACKAVLGNRWANNAQIDDND